MLARRAHVVLAGAIGALIAGACSGGGGTGVPPRERNDAGAPRSAGDSGAEVGPEAALPDSSNVHPHDAGRDATFVDAIADTGTSPNGPDATVDAGPSDAGGTAVVRVHYPAAGHTLSIRGDAPRLGWTFGAPAIASGDGFAFSITGLVGRTEWKPFLDDTIAARGPNYRVAPGETVDVWPHFTSTKGTVTTRLPVFHSTILGNDRAIYAYLPASYAENTVATYPVVYVQDGQNLWAALPQLAPGPTWNVDTAFDVASESGACSAGGVVGWGAQPLGGVPSTCTSDSDCASSECRTFPEAIVIGISNTVDRIHEYTPTTDPGTPGGGGADPYLRMLVEELKPTIDAMLRTRPDVSSTVLAGSALGGLLTAYAGVKRPDVFGRVAELSPSTWWNGDVIVQDVAATPPAPARPLVVYVDSAEGSIDAEADTNLLATAYLGLGYIDGKTFRHVVQPGAQHTEVYWAERFPGAMQFVLGER